MLLLWSNVTKIKPQNIFDSAEYNRDLMKPRVPVLINSVHIFCLSNLWSNHLSSSFFSAISNSAAAASSDANPNTSNTFSSFNEDMVMKRITVRALSKKWNLNHASNMRIIPWLRMKDERMVNSHSTSLWGDEELGLRLALENLNVLNQTTFPSPKFDAGLFCFYCFYCRAKFVILDWRHILIKQDYCGRRQVVF